MPGKHSRSRRFVLLVLVGIGLGALLFFRWQPLAWAGDTDGEVKSQDEMTEMARKAYAANACWIKWWGHANEMRGLINNLGYITLAEEPPSKASAVAAAPGRVVWYSLSHGGVDGSGKYALWFGLWDGDPLNAEDLPADLHYTLVFANACKSASEGSAFVGAFGADAYVGWRGSFDNWVGVAFAKSFFGALKGRQTVQQAVTAGIDSFEYGGYAYRQVVFNIKILRGANVVVDLSSN